MQILAWMIWLLIKAVVALERMTTYNAADDPPGKKVFFL